MLDYVACCVYNILAAMDYLLHHPNDNVNITEFEAECGVGITVTADMIEATVSSTSFNVAICA